MVTISAGVFFTYLILIVVIGLCLIVIGGCLNSTASSGLVLLFAFLVAVALTAVLFIQLPAYHVAW